MTTSLDLAESNHVLPRIYHWFSALVLNDMAHMEELIAHGFPIDVAHPLRHTTALMEATRLGRTKMVEWLLNHGAAPAFLNGLPQGTALHCALRRHHWPIAHQLVNACDAPNVVDAFGHTPLHAICTDTLDREATLEAMELINLLVGKGCALDTLNNEGVTALHLTVINDNPQLTELLLVHGANPNVQTPDEGTSPLMIAALEKNVSVASVLMQHGANPDLRNRDGIASSDMFAGLERLSTDQAGYTKSSALHHIPMPRGRMN